MQLLADVTNDMQLTKTEDRICSLNETYIFRVYIINVYLVEQSLIGKKSIRIYTKYLFGIPKTFYKFIVTVSISIFNSPLPLVEKLSQIITTIIYTH